MPSLPYHEPPNTTLITQAAFLLLLNLIGTIVDHLLYCGLLGQILLGIAFGTPGGQFLDVATQNVIMQLGYIGLILFIYEGGLSVPTKKLRSNMRLAVCVALTGIAFPIGLSFALIPLLGISPLQGFAAGAALCSTSLGTTFEVLNASGLAETRVGAVLGLAAMMDDVVGLVMVQVIGNLGGKDGEVSVENVVRPLGVSGGFAVIVPIVCGFVVGPVRSSAFGVGVARKLRGFTGRREGRFVVHVVFLYGMVAAGAWAGTSVLFMAYLAGAMVSWWDSQGTTTEDALSNPEGSANSEKNVESPVEMASVHQPSSAAAEQIVKQQPDPTVQTHVDATSPVDLSGTNIYRTYLAQPVGRLLKPLFFASIGFAIPISDLFRGPLLWRGLIYTAVMIIGKVICGLWLVRVEIKAHKRISTWIRERHGQFDRMVQNLVETSDRREKTTSEHNKNRKEDHQFTGTDNHTAITSEGTKRENPTTPPTKKPVSLYPGAILGWAMVARGEIGFLIASIAESKGIWRDDSNTVDQNGTFASSDTFIVVNWAIFLCTFVGPIMVGLVVRRLRHLEKKTSHASRFDALGDWGVS